LQHQAEIKLATLSRQITHDLKSPLAAIKKKKKNLNLAEGKDLLNNATRRLDSLVASLGNEGAKEEAPVLLHSLLQQAIAEKLLEHQANIELFCEEQCKFAILPGDNFLWRRVISNLLNNSIEASTNPIIKIEAKKIEKELRISIHDNGKGMSRDLVESLGENPLSKNKPGGKGIGVSSAFAFLHELGGRIEIESEPGSGTSIFLYSPYERESLAILVEDDLILAKLWREAAKQRGIELRHYRSPKEFRSDVKDVAGAFFYLDLQFPGEESGAELGFELSKKGHKNLFLCSGAPGLERKDFPWARAILNKEPPWLA